MGIVDILLYDVAIKENTPPKQKREIFLKKEEKNKKKWVVTKCAEIDLIKEYYTQVLQMSH